MKVKQLAALLSLSLLGCRDDSGATAERAAAFAATPDAESALQRSALVRRAPWWSSAAACRDSLRRSPSRRDAATARLGSWNIRYFPDGAHGEGRLGQGSDVAWLACAIARLDVDVLAVQEFKRSERAARAGAALLSQLQELTGSEWRLQTASCGSPGDSHVGVLWNTARTELTLLRELDATLAGRPCDDNWQPLLSTHFRFPGGFDLHLGVLHFVAGDYPAASRAREHQRRALTAAGRRLLAASPDRDLVLTGDWNTSGCGPQCEERRSARAEIDELGRRLARELEMTLLPANLGCSDYYLNEAGLVDHFAVSRGVELGEGARVMVDGYCAEMRCKDGTPPEAAFTSLSDHCPIVLELPLTRPLARSRERAGSGARTASPGVRSESRPTSAAQPE